MTRSNLIGRRGRGAASRVLRSAARRSGARILAVLGLHRLAGEPRQADLGHYLESPAVPIEVDVREWMAFRGRLFIDAILPAAIEGSAVVSAAVLFESEAWERPVPAGERDSWSIRIPASQNSSVIRLGLRCADGHRYVLSDPSAAVLARHDFHSPHLTFVRALQELQAGLVVEIGSRARSGRTYTDLVPAHLEYLGIDIADGPNVDLVGDAHELSRLVPPGTVDAIFSIATFEHLAMPWRCAVEMNKVLKPGGVCFVLSHQTFPLHETPWDFFRFSDNGWRAIFNDATGFEVLDVAMGEPAAVAGLAITPITWNMDGAAAYLGSAVTCRKIGDASVDWPVALATIERSCYPA